MSRHVAFWLNRATLLGLRLSPITCVRGEGSGIDPSSPTGHPFLEAGLVDDVPADLGARAALRAAVLAHDLGLSEDEAVRLEEAAQVDLGEDARRRSVAGALEAG